MSSNASPPPRVQPLQPPYAPSIEEALAKWMGASREVEPLGLFRTLMVHDAFASRMRPLGAGILGPSSSDPAELREVMIHRTCARCGAEYEWGVHAVVFGEPLGFSEQQLYSTVHGSWTDPCWEPAQASVLRLADELHDTGTVCDELWETLTRTLETNQIIELLVTAGWYHTISYLCNGLRVEREDWAARFPARRAVAGAEA